MSLRSCENCQTCYANAYEHNLWLCYDCLADYGGLTTIATLEVK